MAILGPGERVAFCRSCNSELLVRKEDLRFNRSNMGVYTICSNPDCRRFVYVQDLTGLEPDEMERVFRVAAVDAAAGFTQNTMSDLVGGSN